MFKNLIFFIMKI